MYSPLVVHFPCMYNPMLSDMYDNHASVQSSGLAPNDSRFGSHGDVMVSSLNARLLPHTQTHGCTRALLPPMLRNNTTHSHGKSSKLCGSLNFPRLSDAASHVVRIQYDRSLLPSHIAQEGFSCSPASMDHMKWGSGTLAVRRRPSCLCLTPRFRRRDSVGG